MILERSVFVVETDGSGGCTALPVFVLSSSSGGEVRTIGGCGGGGGCCIC